MGLVEITTSQKVRIDNELATTMDRIIATFIDNVVIVVFYFILYYIIQTSSLLIGTSLGYDGWRAFAYSYVLITFLYFLLFEYLWQGYTVGKKIVGIKIVGLSGYTPNFSEYFLRTVFRIVEINLTGGLLAIIVTIVSDKNQRIGDIASNTAVIKTKKAAQFNISDISSINKSSDYVVSFPEVKQLNEEDMLVVKSALTRNVKYKKKYAFDTSIDRLAKKVKASLAVESELSDVEFLKTVLRDYIILTR